MEALVEEKIPSEPDEAAIERMEALRQEVEGAWLPDFELHFEKLELRYEPKLYLLLPIYPWLDPKDLADLSLALRYCVYATLLTDQVIDLEQDATSRARGILRIQAFQFECYQILYRLFPPRSEFWRRYRTYLSQFARACLEEKRYADGTYAWEDCSEERAMDLVRGKNSLAKLLAASLAELSGEDREFPNVARSVEKYYTAWQLWDDLCDWKEDFKDGVPSPLLTAALSELPSPERREGCLPHLARKIYYEGHAVRTLDRALLLLEEADGELALFKDLAWREFISDLRCKCEALRDDLSRIIQGNLERARAKRKFDLGARVHRDLFEETAWCALGFLVDQWHLGFGEAKHVAYMARELGYRGESEYPSGDVFQRALILDALCDADRWLDGRVRPILEEEARYLLAQRSESGVGGWRYFPSIPELAPDADDLGQVMQALLRSGFASEVERSCETPIAVVLEDAKRRGGAFSTWIIPQDDRGPLEEVQADLRENNWGPGPDGEVMANLLFALALYDRDRFAPLLEKGAEFLEAHQEEDGSWKSKWYFGPFYGTYVALRLLSVVRPRSRAIPAARSFLLDAQREDGGWGFRDGSDPLSTSLALLGLSTLPRPGSLSPDRTMAAVRYLDGARDADGGWPAVPFVAIPAYGSRTITALYVLRACLWSGVFASRRGQGMAEDLLNERQER